MYQSSSRGISARSLQLCILPRPAMHYFPDDIAFNRSGRQLPIYNTQKGHPWPMVRPTDLRQLRTHIHHDAEPTFHIWTYPSLTNNSELLSETATQAVPFNQPRLSSIPSTLASVQTRSPCALPTPNRFGRQGLALPQKKASASRFFQRTTAKLEHSHPSLSWTCPIYSHPARCGEAYLHFVCWARPNLKQVLVKR